MLRKNTNCWFYFAAGLYLLDAVWCLFIKNADSQSYMLSFLAGLHFLVLAELAGIRQDLRGEKKCVFSLCDKAASYPQRSAGQKTIHPKY